MKPLNYAHLVLPVILGAVSLAARPAPAAVPGEALLYQGQALGQGGVSVASWGAGSVLDSTDFSMFSGANDHAFQVTTLGYYQGAKLNFEPAAALGTAPEGQTRVLQISIRPIKLAADPAGVTMLDRNGFGGGDLSPDAGQGNGYPGAGGNGYPGAGGGGGYPGANPGGEQPGSSSPGGGYPGANPGGEQPGGSSPGGGYPGGGYPGAEGGGMGGGPFGGRTRRPAAAPSIKTMRILFTLADGRQADILRPVPVADKTEDWVDLSVPLPALKFSGKGTDLALAAAPQALKSITLGGDLYGQFYVGRVRLLDDNAPISGVSAGPEQTVRGGQLVGFHASADGGASMLKYSWNFGLADAQGEQATGADVATQFPQSQASKDYTVTLTVSDLDGLKKSVSATTIVHVRRGGRGGGGYPGAGGGGYPGGSSPGGGYPGANPGGGYPGANPGGEQPGSSSPGGEGAGMSSPGG